MKRRVRMLLGPFAGEPMEYPRVEAENLVASGWAEWIEHRPDALTPPPAEPSGPPAKPAATAPPAKAKKTTKRSSKSA